MNEQRLHRPVYARLAGTTGQAILSLFALSTVALIVLVVAAPLFGKSVGGLSWWIVPDVLLTTLWLRGFTAWATFDDEGVHSRFYLRSDYPWSGMHSVTLQRIGNIASATVSGPPAIVIRMHKPAGDEDKLTPALRCGRHRREFGTALLAAGRAHGVRAVVGSSGWDEAQDQHVDLFEG